MKRDNVVYIKSRAFAIRSGKMYQHLTSERKEFILAKQFLRAATSIGANVTAALCAISRKEFLSKSHIAYKECAETCYWIDILHELGYLTDPEFESINHDCDEPIRLLAAITKNTRESLTSSPPKKKIILAPQAS